jgi:tetratricopeptide (TPR) repeat protein
MVVLLLLTLVQAPADRATLESLRDSLSLVTDSVALARLEAATIEIAKKYRDDPLIHLRLGFIAYRLGEITKDKSHYDDAAGEFEWAGELRPDWPYPWYGEGLSELAIGEAGAIAIENLRQMLGKDYLSKAARAFARATLADPSFASAVVDLANTALTQRIRPRLDV